MKKLNLDLDQLAVESFDTSAAQRRTGTVRAHGFTETSCNQIICDCGPTNVTCETDCDQDTCGASCVNICPPTDHGERTCNQPSCFYSCACVSHPDFTTCCLQ
jgi:hypothetical protein